MYGDGYTVGVLKLKILAISDGILLKIRMNLPGSTSMASTEDACWFILIRKKGIQDVKQHTLGS
jgi:hypothetical protein